MYYPIDRDYNELVEFAKRHPEFKDKLPERHIIQKGGMNFSFLDAIRK